MTNFELQKFETESHNEELDSIFNQDLNDIEDSVFNNRDLLRDFKAFLRFTKKKFNKFIRENSQKNYTSIYYLTLDCPTYTKHSTREDSPLEFISKMREQYPENIIKILIPIINTEIKEKPIYHFEFFLQNKINSAYVYKLPSNKLNIDVYGIYSESFSNCKDIVDLAKLQNIAPFIKAARMFLSKTDCDIVHAENIPYFLGEEFEHKILSHIKVLQIIKDFTQIDIAKYEAFWAAINLADKYSIKRICNDSIIKKHIAALFNLHNTRKFYKMKDCLDFIYQNYPKFRKYIDKGEDIEENIIFNRLNARILQLFPNMSHGEDLYFNPMTNSIKRANFWAVISKTYYNEIFENPHLSGKIHKQLVKTKEKSSWVSCGFNAEKYKEKKIYQNFNIDNFREQRNKNKIQLLKEFNIDRIKTGFVDTTLFQDEAKIIGNLDSFYEAPLLFANTNIEIFANGVDILFNSILKLFELHKNIQTIICIPNGLKVNFVKSWIDFLEQNKYLSGRWVFIDGNINPEKFYAASDMTLIPRRANMCNSEHYIAMHYGCVPIASRSGILNDTIADIFDDVYNGCGFKTKTGLLTEEDNNVLFLTPLIKALGIYQNNPSSWNLLVKNCLTYDSNWKFEILERYNKIYTKILDS